MKKTEIVERVRGEAGITKRLSQAAVSTVFASIAEALVLGEHVTIARFSRFSRNNRAVRERRNPRTSERIAIGPSARVSFKAGKALKDGLKLKCLLLLHQSFERVEASEVPRIVSISRCPDEKRILRKMRLALRSRRPYR